MSESLVKGAYVRITNNGDHHVMCAEHGVIAWHIRDYRFALHVAAQHDCKPTEEGL